jgi:hypothetical protein
MGLYTADGARKYLTAGERETFLRAAERADEERTLCMTLAYGGCRLSEPWRSPPTASTSPAACRCSKAPRNDAAPVAPAGRGWIAALPRARMPPYIHISVSCISNPASSIAHVMRCAVCVPPKHSMCAGASRGAQRAMCLGSNATSLRSHARPMNASSYGGSVTTAWRASDRAVQARAGPPKCEATDRCDVGFQGLSTRRYHDRRYIELMQNAVIGA